MRRVVTAANASFELEDFTPTPPGAGEVQMRVHAAGVCGSDLHGYRRGDHWPAGLVRGHEIAGEISAVGAGVDGLHAGDRVAIEPLIYCERCEYCLAGDYDLCLTRTLLGVGPPGGFAEYMTVPAHAAFPVPHDLDLAVAALAEPLSVAIHGMRVAASMVGETAPGRDRVVVLGGGVIGLMAAFYARQCGAAEVAVTARYPQQAEMALALGATHTFDSAEPASVHRWAEEHPVDCVVEAVGGEADTVNQSLELVRPGGRVLILGVFLSPVTVRTGLMLRKQPRVVSTLTYSRSGPHADYEVAIDLLDRHRDLLARLITHRFPLAEIDRAFAVAADKSSGAIKVTVEPGR